MSHGGPQHVNKLYLHHQKEDVVAEERKMAWKRWSSHVTPAIISSCESNEA